MQHNLIKKTALIFLSGILLLMTGCTTGANSNGYTYGVQNGQTCTNIKQPIALSTFQDEYKYLEAEIQDLKAMKNDGKLTNVNYLKKTDKIKASFPREFIWVEPNIASQYFYHQDKNRYIANLFPSLPDPLGLVMIPVIYLEMDKFPELDKSFKAGEKINVLITNSDSTIGGFYYSVVKIKIGDTEFENIDFCN